MRFIYNGMDYVTPFYKEWIASVVRQGPNCFCACGKEFDTPMSVIDHDSEEHACPKTYLRHFNFYGFLGMWECEQCHWKTNSGAYSGTYLRCFLGFLGRWLRGRVCFSSSHTHWSTEDHYTSFKCRLHSGLVCCELTFILICLQLIVHLASCTMHAFSVKILIWTIVCTMCKKYYALLNFLFIAFYIFLFCIHFLYKYLHIFPFGCLQGNVSQFTPG